MFVPQLSDVDSFPGRIGLLNNVVSYGQVNALIGFTSNYTDSQCYVNATAFTFQIWFSEFSSSNSFHLSLFSTLLSIAQINVLVQDSVSAVSSSLSLLWRPDDSSTVTCSSSFIYTFGIFLLFFFN